ncbi:hypothetical protein OG259_07605 [Streptomyces sp. NBC_00250]|uniref:hypothetical protein n=1 Tax=Streptomyces sp. NBC_00250 TaxID=2903641 RepID=UPI002E293E27|nr:hypothetical protein [Streptomyces sp. NBC_00250]
MVAEEIQAEIDQLGVMAVAPGQAELALALARTFDETEAPTSRAVVARELGVVMKTLRALAPVRSEGDALDEIQARREKRRHSA